MKTEASGKASETVCLNLVILWSFFFFVCFSCTESSCYSTVWRRCIFCMQRLLKCNAKTISSLEVAKIQYGSCLWGASWTRMHRAGDIWQWVCKHRFPWMWKCVHIDPNHVYVDFFFVVVWLWLNCKEQVLLKFMYRERFNSLCETFFRLNLVSSDEKLH